MAFRLLTLFLFVLAWPSAGRAWTDAHVRDAQVRLNVRAADRRVDVTLDLGVEVRGGWLERLDLPGFDEGLELATEEPALAVLASGERVAAKVVVRPAVISLRFQRRDGLRRGLHHVLLRYSSELSVAAALTNGATTRIAWTLPGWEAGLASASIEVSGDVAGLLPVADADVAQEVSTAGQGAGQTVRFTRLLVPRASPWSVAVDVPDLAPARASQAELHRSAEAGDERPYATGFALALVQLVLVVLRRRFTGGESAPVGLWRIGLGDSWGLAPLALLAAVGGLLWVHALPLALLAWSALAWLGLPRTAQALEVLPLGRFEPLGGGALRRLERMWQKELLGLPWADCASVLGASTSLLLLGVIALDAKALDLSGDPWGLGALCGLFGAAFTSRLRKPRSLAEQVRILVRAAGRTRTVGCALSLVAYAAQGRLHQPRLRLAPGARYPGLLRLEVLVDSRRHARPLWLSASVEAGSAAERWLHALWPEAVRESGAGGQRLVLLTPIVQVGPEVEVLLEHLSRESQRIVCQAAPRSATALSTALRSDAASCAAAQRAHAA